jgi:hypothetical protein
MGVNTNRIKGLVYVCGPQSLIHDIPGSTQQRAGWTLATRYLHYSVIYVIEDSVLCPYVTQFERQFLRHDELRPELLLVYRMNIIT